MSKFIGSFICAGLALCANVIVEASQHNPSFGNNNGAQKSVWLETDSGSVRRNDLRACRAKGESYLDVFTDDPAVIGRWLPRPVTPFVPAPEGGLAFSNNANANSQQKPK
jgi:hypothetical protein